MQIKELLILPLLFGIGSTAVGAPEDMDVQTWDFGCEHTMTTNHFELAPREFVQVNIDLTGCGPEKLGGLLFFGYNTTRNSSKTLIERDNIRLTLVKGDSGAEISSDSGSVYVEIFEPMRLVLYAENMNHRKTRKIRLRSSSGL